MTDRVEDVGVPAAVARRTVVPVDVRVRRAASLPGVGRGVFVWIDRSKR